MSPGWENVRIGLADSQQHRRRVDLWKLLLILALALLAWAVVVGAVLWLR